MKRIFNFTGRRPIWYVISLLIIIPGIISLVMQGFNQGIDFTGGTIVQVAFTEPVDQAAVREVVSRHVTQTPAIQASENNGYLIRTTQMTEEESTAMIEDLRSSLGELELERNDLIGPVVGKELLRNAQWAILIALLLMLIYISIRFKFNFALSAVCALAHDLLVVISIFSLLQIEIDSAFVAAVLTVLGYSINNTIVIFDRIRENGRFAKNSKSDLAVEINTGITQTLTRSINTVVAVLLLLVCLMLLGGETTKMFAFAIIVGAVAGTYSSIFLAGSFLLDFTKLRNRFKGAANH